MILPVILSGGSGTRLWPYSRSLYPKQFLPLVSDQTMIQETMHRLTHFDSDKIEIDSPLIICNEAHRFIVAEQLRSINLTPKDIILEPFGRNTAPAIALAALAQPDAVLLVLPADHVIKNITAFQESVIAAKKQALEGKLVTFGIVPTSAETGYGYVKAGAAIDTMSSVVEQFVEKPDQTTANQYLASGKYLWNSGMFLFKASRYIEELERCHPQMLHSCRQAIDNVERDLDFTRIDADTFQACPEDSIDYAVMEKTEDAVVVPLQAGWNDIGSWSALWEASEQDESGNVLKKGSGDVITLDSNGCYVQAEHKLIATIGLENTVIVETDDSIMVADKNRVQDVKTIVNQLKQENRNESSLHRKVYRPWGYYDSIDCGERFQVKRIVVNPGAQLSLQMHHHRAEHWIVVQGTAQVRCGEKNMLLSENQSAYIPLGEVHQLSNPGKFPLEIIEVQSGSYLGEDDIVRLEDVYGRE
ncbi:mannose-1-phosphate guanylyltransferase/mannose-6-phosphate isomerase [Candidatus Endobugula sertula]|uniref:mannose-1-phosphate guanylyltransferase n=1 Tax=Candidatus Endobugula sertula TaxID=62101 RepID=A0A1D2QQK0_9GAMM|nr:mannose-1-phosphate guanylyltransferase/mannose-6-phosphate isomerase [Candidatus Endobugula sertula]